MKVKGNLPDNHGPYNRLIPQKKPISETNIKKESPEMLEDRAKPDSEFVELEGGFTMYPAEILNFSDGSDNPV